jgi:putative peptidoglycan lipid II flippase
MKRAVIGLVGGGMLGKLAGIARELLIAAFYGTGTIAAAYRLAQSAVLIPVNFFTADVLNAAAVPLLKRYRKESDGSEAKFTLISLLFFGAIGFLIAIVIECEAPRMVHLIAPGFSKDEKFAAIEFVKILAAGVPLYVLSTLLSYLEMAAGGYTLTSLRSTISNVGLILFTPLAYFLREPTWLAWGFVLSQAACFIWGIARIRRLKLITWISIEWDDVKKITHDFWTLMRHLIMLPIFMQGSVIAERIVASWIGGGTVAALDYARIIADTGNILITVPFALAVLGELSGKSITETRRKLKQVLTVVMLFTVPLSAFLCAHATLVVSLIYKRGAFDSQSVVQTAAILRTMGAGFWAQSLAYIFQKALAAQSRNGSVIKILVVALCFSIITNLIAYRWLGAATLGISTSLFGIIGATLSARSCGFKLGEFSDLGWLVLAGIIYVAISRFVPWGGGLVSIMEAAAVSVFFWGTVVTFHRGLRMQVRSLVNAARF